MSSLPLGPNALASPIKAARTLVAEATERSGGGACPTPLRSCRQLRRRRCGAVDVLVDPAVVRTAVAAPGFYRAALRLDGEDDAALDDIGGRCVLVLRRFARVRALK